MALNIGKQTHIANIDGKSYTVYTYRPPGETKGLLVVHHGASGTGEDTRDQAIQIALEMGYAIISPRLDRLTNAEYQMGGVTSSSSPDSWVVSIEKEFVEWGIAQASLDANDPVVLFGHSGGGQYVGRVTAFAPDDRFFDAMIVSNPSTNVLPSMTEKAPYGFGGFSTSQATAMLKDYLADPVTIYLGSEDDDPNSSDLATGAAAMRQGDNRLERGLYTFNEAKKVAASKGWEFNWELVIADGVGHTSAGMLRAPEMRDAIDNQGDSPSSAPARLLTPADPVVSTMSGTLSSDSPTGTSDADVISGVSGSEKLSGKGGNDILIGGSGEDSFNFDTPLSVTNVDIIKDFNAPDDTIALSNTIFAKLSEGSLRASNFRAGDKPLDRDDYVIYDENTGALYYDTDGSSAAAAMKFAEIENKARLAAADFIVT
jgi:hypothetical protein